MDLPWFRFRGIPRCSAEVVHTLCTWWVATSERSRAPVLQAQFGSPWSWLKGEVNVGFLWFPKMEVPKNGWFIREYTIEMDDVGVPPFMEAHICTYL